MADSLRPVAIVTDGMWRKSLSAIRSLGKAGYRVHVFGDTRLTVGFWSRFTEQRVLAPDARVDPNGFAGALMRHLHTVRSEMPEGPRPVLLPMEDESLREVVAHIDTLSQQVDVLLPDAAALETCSDKAATMMLAASLGLPHPRTRVASSPEELQAAMQEASGAEFVVKPLRGSGSRGVRYTPTFTPAESESYLSSYGPVLVQERIPPEGEALGVSVLFDDGGDCIAHFEHRRIHQYPNSGGPSTDRVGIVDDGLLDQSLQLLRKLRWKGVAMVEWKVHPIDGRPRLMEINPRFWGSLELAVRSGVDFPALYAHAAGRRPYSAPTPIPGVRCRWLVPGDVLRWLTAHKSERESLRFFCKGLPSTAEEWDRKDLRGALACVVCQALAVLQPKYRGMLKR